MVETRQLHEYELVKAFWKVVKMKDEQDERTRQNVGVMFSTKPKIICGSLKSDFLQKHLQNVSIRQNLM